ncbi:MAG: hypothetical protein GW906_02180 [Epsilonproteobacteria bacterium]|nr:hypothetical protein [Campylobacterota bacterium]OIO14750.1 MAG: hypothetical protein AUJ81_08755 [Helicobacteraceae bacterium CG1_02_36_14]PIP09191.1 MAG: hypothetical protein COX50_12235 [Sulfurimonas sp. CG23_combo_of_CG06-09_8_20_14_all_36_33]PIS25119.1 MAG: hypothetical protein COT46_07060 [Sulfurimonas sp. CG08_land_8_20_14_0_20_36_33]PIU34622.1 MAG: hypothetical protein COT05_06815 [Sulfurimonas sp. CG07_land_8_20_14_0_80_36_56]PIV04451.1 MAG: hypothetical protein COS56_04805 [Sulfur
MTFSKTNKKESCQHDEYCDFSETLCETTDLAEHCQMRDSDIDEMPLLKKVKERVERDKERNKK